MKIKSPLKIAGLSACLLFILNLKSELRAAEFIVDTLSDESLEGCDPNAANDCSLRGALAKAGQTPLNGDTEHVIRFAESVRGSIVVQGSTLSIPPVKIRIQGPGAKSLKLTTTSTSEDLSGFRIDGGNGNIDCEISGLTIQDFRNSEIVINSGSSRLVLDGVNIPQGGGGDSAIRIFHPGDNLTIRNSTISNHTGSGGAIEANGTIIRVSNSTFSRNDGRGAGGGILAKNSSIFLDHVTFTQNVSSNIPGGTLEGEGGAVYLEGGRLEMRNSILAGNVRELTPSHDSFAASDIGGQDDAVIVSHGFNIIGTIEPSTAEATFSISLADTDIVLGADADVFAQILSPGLADNGGETPTHGLLEGSPAIDGADCADIDGNPVGFDQRSIGRPIGQDCDIGAFEGFCGDANTPREACLFDNTSRDSDQISGGGCALVAASFSGQGTAANGFVIALLLACLFGLRTALSKRSI